jgi:hypothetical protein
MTPSANNSLTVSACSLPEGTNSVVANCAHGIKTLQHILTELAVHSADWEYHVARNEKAMKRRMGRLRCAERDAK